jgi:hypothetical protein
MFLKFAGIFFVILISVSMPHHIHAEHRVGNGKSINFSIGTQNEFNTKHTSKKDSNHVETRKPNVKK